MNDTETQPKLTKEEYDFLLRFLLEEINRLNSKVAEGVAGEGECKHFVDMFNSIHPKLIALTETK
ncbi:MAG: hypothetical protein Q4C88_05955 [Akkermansia sp.]|nr:hypothetical protein [Akkermansia sp.]